MRIQPDSKRALLKRSLQGLLFPLALVVAAGCGSGSGGSLDDSQDDNRPRRDTCTRGDNMTDPSLLAGIEQDGSGAARVRIVWSLGTERGAELPAVYFDNIEVEGT